MTKQEKEELKYWGLNNFKEKRAPVSNSITKVDDYYKAWDTDWLPIHPDNEEDEARNTAKDTPTSDPQVVWLYSRIVGKNFEGTCKLAGDLYYVTVKGDWQHTDIAKISDSCEIYGKDIENIITKEARKLAHDMFIKSL